MALRYAVDGGCAVLTLDRPEARNAIDGATARGIEDGIDRAEADEAIRVLILTSTPPVFCAGADLKEIGAGRAADLSTARGGFAGLVRRQRRKPLIAAVDGPALAGGTEIVLACDLVVASTTARFGIPEVKRGLIAGGGGLFRLGHRIPQNIAMELALTGDPIDAEQAHRFGLVNELCDPGHALEQAFALAGRIVANAPLAVEESRAVILGSATESEDWCWSRTDRAAARVLASEDVQEGVAAFVQRRPPVWRGR